MVAPEGLRPLTRCIPTVKITSALQPVPAQGTVRVRSAWTVTSDHRRRDGVRCRTRLGDGGDGIWTAARADALAAASALGFAVRAWLRRESPPACSRWKYRHPFDNVAMSHGNVWRILKNRPSEKNEQPIILVHCSVPGGNVTTSLATLTAGRSFGDFWWPSQAKEIPGDDERLTPR